jgi:hypothetical protein
MGLLPIFLLLSYFFNVSKLLPDSEESIVREVMEKPIRIAKKLMTKPVKVANLSMLAQLKIKQ